MSLRFKEELYTQGGAIEYVYFPEGSVISVVNHLGEGGSIETSTIGNEGMVGLSAVLGMGTAPSHVFCQIPGRAIRLSARCALEERRRGGQLAELLLRFAHVTIAMLTQSVACNRAHSVEERMCRWLLMTHDRAGADEFPLTQEYLGQMLGVRRPTVNLAGTALQRAGLIRYSRGRIRIVDRSGLEDASCECYARVRDEFARALGEPQQAHGDERR